MSIHTFGWQDNGEYHCACGAIFGKNLLDQRPFLLVSQHVKTCVPHMIARLRTNHPLTNPGQYNQDKWDQAVREYLKGVYNEASRS